MRGSDRGCLPIGVSCRAMPLTNDDVAAFFAETPVRINGNVNLRVPQVDG
jgi:hypothetical protein